MNNEVNIDELKELADMYYNQALALMENNQLSNACIELKKTIAVAEKIYHLTTNQDDLNFLINNYQIISKCYHRIYQVTLEKKDLSPANIYFEKIIYFYEEELKQKKIDIVKSLIKIMEVYVRVLWNYLEIKDIRSYEKFKTKAYKHARKLAMLSNTYEDEQYLIIVMIFEGDYQKTKENFKKAYLIYFLAMKKLTRIYYKLPQEGIKNDLLMLYSNLSNLAKILNKTKQKQKWDQNIKELGGE